MDLVARKEADGVVMMPSSSTRVNRVVGSPMMVKDSGTRAGVRQECGKKEERWQLWSTVAHRWLLVSSGVVVQVATEWRRWGLDGALLPSKE